MLRWRNHYRGFRQLLAWRLFGSSFDFRHVPADHRLITQLFRQRLPLFQHFDRASYIAFT